VSILDHIRFPKPRQTQEERDAAAFYDALNGAATQTLLDLLETGTVKASFYAEALSHRPVMWLVTPSASTTARYFPEEWERLVYGADYLGLDLMQPASWFRQEGGRYGH
jgi:hypothetical protein